VACAQTKEETRSSVGVPRRAVSVADVDGRRSCQFASRTRSNFVDTRIARPVPMPVLREPWTESVLDQLLQRGIFTGLRARSAAGQGISVSPI
jgi:hypothetical protein